ncbi:unnamed protein product [Ilex paraguariensis]|uniref:Uncharacterized protein n=1 Tax=Ilex paraguariensis TaxID=185542 RepID=A0ABC8U4I2_9AQUA
MTLILQAMIPNQVPVASPVLKKHKLVSNLILPENNENINIPRSRQKDLLDPGMGAHFEFGKLTRCILGQAIKAKQLKKLGCVTEVGVAATEQHRIRHENQKCNVGSLDRSGRSNVTAASNNCPNVLEKQVNHAKPLELLRQMKRTKGKSGVYLFKKTHIFLFHQSDQLVSSSYLTLPSVLSEAQ